MEVSDVKIHEHQIYSLMTLSGAHCDKSAILGTRYRLRVGLIYIFFLFSVRCF